MLKRLACAATLAAATNAPLAQALVDPTRPPTAPAASASTLPDAPAATAPSRLQSVLISQGRRVAVIDGVQVPVGGTVGQATLVRLTETEAVLRRGTETEVLKLLPGIEKKPVGRKGAGGARP